MRGTLSVLFVLAASIPAAAQPSATPPYSDTADTPEPAYARPAPTYYTPAYMPAPVVVPATRREAHGVYFTESVGGMNIHDEASDTWGGAVRLRIAAGYRRKQLAFELWAAAGIGWSDRSYETHGSYLSLTDGAPSPTHDHHHSSRGIGMVGFDVKYIKTLSRHVEVYARGGLSHAYAGDLGDGRGLGIGAGAQLKGKVPVIGFLFWPLFFTGLGPKCTAAVFAETGYEFYRLHGAVRSTDAQVTQWTLGFAVGSDF